MMTFGTSRRSGSKSWCGLAAVLCMGLGLACAPIVPQRTKQGGAARWAASLALNTAVTWAADAELCRITGAGVGIEGWLPDKGGFWQLDYWSPSKPFVLEVTVDADGGVKSQEASQNPNRGHSLPKDWADSPKVWAATRPHQRGEPLSTLDAELSTLAEPERYPNRLVWRIRFFLTLNGYETHVVSAEGDWLTSY